MGVGTRRSTLTRMLGPSGKLFRRSQRVLSMALDAGMAARTAEGWGERGGGSLGLYCTLASVSSLEPV